MSKVVILGSGSSIGGGGNAKVQTVGKIPNTNPKLLGRVRVGAIALTGPSANKAPVVTFYSPCNHIHFFLTWDFNGKFGSSTELVPCSDDEF
ncbi:hypothetical protein ACLB2K_074043 [Fragaria x ananassa]